MLKIQTFSFYNIKIQPQDAFFKFKVFLFNSWIGIVYWICGCLFLALLLIIVSLLCLFLFFDKWIWTHIVFIHCRLSICMYLLMICIVFHFILVYSGIYIVLLQRDEIPVNIRVRLRHSMIMWVILCCKFITFETLISFERTQVIYVLLSLLSK